MLDVEDGEEILNGGEMQDGETDEEGEGMLDTECSSALSHRPEKPVSSLQSVSPPPAPQHNHAGTAQLTTNPSCGMEREITRLIPTAQKPSTAQQPPASTQHPNKQHRATLLSLTE
ncbi:hypothetical protein SRHO_G00226500 [Serrasalmus rhombeus]